MRRNDVIYNHIKSLTHEQLKEFIGSLDENELNAILYDWDLWARDEQLCYRRKEFILLIRCGRGWGKTRTISEAIIEWEREGFRYMSLANASPAACRDINVAGESGILRCAPPWNKPQYISTKAMLVWQSGATLKLFSGAHPEQSRGYQSEKVVLDELFAYKYPEDVFQNLSMGCRLGKHPQILIASTPKPTAFMKKLMSYPDTCVITGSTFENKANLSQTFIDQMREKYEGTRIGLQELYGEVLDDNPNAIFTLDSIEKNRKELPASQEIIEIIISVDPSVSVSKNANETGIIVAAQSSDGHIYIIDDLSLQAPPDVWVKVVADAYQNYNANNIIVETNQGGALVETAIHQIDPNIPIKPVYARKGKVARAEPVAVAYERGIVHHVATFATLEQQMYEYETGMKSPDRMDALVHAVSYFLDKSKSKSTWNEPLPAVSTIANLGFSSNSETIFTISSVETIFRR